MRNWCGDTSNPPGIFLSGKIYINPFQNVPILKDWVLEKAHTLHAFVSIDANSGNDFDISNYFIQVLSDLGGIVNRISNHLHNSLETLEFALGNMSTKIILKLKNVVNAFQNTLRAYINYIPKNGLNGLAAALTDLWKQATDIENQMNEFEDITEYPANIATQSFILLINSEIEIIKSSVHDAIKDLSNQLHTAVQDISGFGLKYSCSLTIFGLRLGLFDIEMITSKTSLMECSRFQKVRELLKGEHALRIIGRRSIGTKATFFLTIGVGVGGAFGLTTQNAILQLNAYVTIIGIRTTADLFISRSGLYIYLEGNVWGIFLAQLDISAELGKEWHQLTFSLEGRFVAKTSRKRQTQTDRSSFQSSYLDGLIEAAKIISNVADKRISQAQKLITLAQSGVTKAQNWLEEKKEDVRKAHTTFDNAVAALDDAKSKLEEAKGPYKVAIEKLNRAQRNVDNLCRIRSCRTICIPGLRLKLCKSGWFRYPCLRFTKCMISFPDPLCEMANLV